MTENIHSVQKKTWSKWTESGRALFNAVYEEFEDQTVMMHPDSVPMSARHWDTVRWNAAWIAADRATKIGKAGAASAALSGIPCR